MTDEKFAILRIAKLRFGWHRGGFQRSLRHLEKHEVCGNIEHPELSKYNRVFNFCEKPKEEVKKAITFHNSISKKKLRKDSSIATEMVLTFSKTNMPISKWVNANYNWLQKEFPTMKILKIQLDMDESTPHLHVISIPTDKDGKISAKRVLGGPADFKKHQDSYALAMEQFGLKRGLPKSVSKNKHKSLTRYQQEIYAEAENTLKTALKEAENMRSISEFAPDFLRAENLQKEIEKVRER